MANILVTVLQIVKLKYRHTICLILPSVCRGTLLAPNGLLVLLAPNGLLVLLAPNDPAALLAHLLLKQKDLHARNLLLGVHELAEPEKIKRKNRVSPV